MVAILCSQLSNGFLWLLKWNPKSFHGPQGSSYLIWPLPTSFMTVPLAHVLQTRCSSFCFVTIISYSHLGDFKVVLSSFWNILLLALQVTDSLTLNSQLQEHLLRKGFPGQSKGSVPPIQSFPLILPCFIFFIVLTAVLNDLVFILILYLLPVKYKFSQSKDCLVHCCTFVPRAESDSYFI